MDDISVTIVSSASFYAIRMDCGEGRTDVKATCGGLAETGSSDPNFGGGPRSVRLGQGAGTPEKFDVDLPVYAARRANRNQERHVRPPRDARPQAVGESAIFQRIKLAS